MGVEHEEAMVLLQVMTFGQQIGVMKATSALWADDFDPSDPGEHVESVRTVLYYGEMLGTFVKSGALSRALVNDMLWIGGLWEKVGPFALQARRDAGVPGLWENFEALALG
jgi:hypothetical protein